MVSLAIGALLFVGDPAALAAKELSAFLGRPVASVVKQELGRVRHVSNEQGNVAIVADRKLFLLSAKDGLVELPLRVPAGSAGFAYVRVAPNRQWAAFGDGEEKVALGSEKRLISLTGVGSAHFDANSTLLAVPSFERPLVPPSGTIAGIPIRMSPHPSLWTPTLSLSSGDSPEGLELEATLGEISAKCATGPGYRPEWPNLNYSPLGERLGLVTRSSGSPDFSDAFLFASAVGKTLAKAVFGAWSALGGVALVMDSKGSRLVEVATGKTAPWKSGWRPIWIPGTSSSLLYEIGGEATTVAIATFQKGL
jgi:hypothetical protein